MTVKGNETVSLQESTKPRTSASGKERKKRKRRAQSEEDGADGDLESPLISREEEGTEVMQPKRRKAETKEEVDIPSRRSTRNRK